MQQLDETTRRETRSTRAALERRFGGETEGDAEEDADAAATLRRGARRRIG